MVVYASPLTAAAPAPYCMYMCWSLTTASLHPSTRHDKPRNGGAVATGRRSDRRLRICSGSSTPRGEGEGRGGEGGETGRRAGRRTRVGRVPTQQKDTPSFDSNL